MNKENVAEIWKMNDPRKGIMEFGYKAGEGPKITKQRPEWMLNFSRSWPSPNGPIIFQFTLKEGHEQDAIDFLYNDIQETDHDHSEQ